MFIGTLWWWSRYHLMHSGLAVPPRGLHLYGYGRFSEYLSLISTGNAIYLSGLL